MDTRCQYEHYYCVRESKSMFLLQVKCVCIIELSFSLYEKCRLLRQFWNHLRWVYWHIVLIIWLNLSFSIHFQMKIMGMVSTGISFMKMWDYKFMYLLCICSGTFYKSLFEKKINWRFSSLRQEEQWGCAKMTNMFNLDGSHCGNCVLSGYNRTPSHVDV